MAAESINHICSQCAFSRMVWDNFRGTFVRLPCEEGWVDWILWAGARFQGNDKVARLGRLTICATIYHLWKERNARTHGNLFRDPTGVIEDIKGMLEHCELVA